MKTRLRDFFAAGGTWRGGWEENGQGGTEPRNPHQYDMLLPDFRLLELLGMTIPSTPRLRKRVARSV